MPLLALVELRGKSRRTKLLWIPGASSSLDIATHLWTPSHQTMHTSEQLLPCSLWVQ